MKKIALAFILLASLSMGAQKGKQFPVVNGTLLNDKAFSLPVNNSKYTIVAIAYHRGAEDFLKQWLNPLFDNFMQSETSSSSFDMGDPYDVNFVFVPMISGFKKIRDDFKKGTDKGYWPYILDTEKTDIKELQKELEVKDNKIPYFYILNKEGVIVAVESGKYTKAKMTKLEEAIE